MYQRSELGFGLSGSTVALSLDQAIDFKRLRPSWVERIVHVRDSARDLDLVPDLGCEIGSLTWIRGFATCLVLCATALSFLPGIEPLEGSVVAPQSGDAWEETRAQTIAPLAWGSDTGRRMAANDFVETLATSPERPTIDVTATLGQGDGFARVLERNGVGGTEARKIAAMVAGVTSLDQIAPGTIMSMTLGERPSKDVARPLELLSFRARFDLKVAVRRSNGALALQRLPIAIDNSPLRIRGRVNGGLYRSARAAGAPASAVEAYIKALASKDMLSAAMQPNVEFDIVVQQAKAETGEMQHGKLLYAGLNTGARDFRLLQWAIGSRTEWFEASGVGQKRAGMVQPVENARMSSGFGMRFHPILGYGKFHKGVDFAAVYGTPIRAATDGLVAFAGRSGGYGNQIRLSHTAAFGTSYSHLSRIAVAPGSRVRQGQVIGYVGSTGLSTGPHLHFEVYRNGLAVNPRTVSFESRSLLSGQELALFRARLNAMLNIPVSGGQVAEVSYAASGAQRLSR